MEFKNGAVVFTNEGKEAGSLQGIVIDPETNVVTHIVIQKGLLRDDKVIQADRIASATADKIALNYSAIELDDLAPLTVRQQVVKSGAPYREASHNMFLNTARENSVVSVKKRTIPVDLVVLNKGAHVFTAEGEHVGNIECAFTDSDTDKISQFLISQGLLLKSRRRIPIQWVEFMDEDEIWLSIGSDQMQAMGASKN